MSDNDDLKIHLFIGLFFFALLGLALLSGHYIFDTPWRDMTDWALIAAALIVVAVLNNAIPAFERAVQTGFAYYMAFTVIIFALLLPGTAYFKAAQWVAETRNDALKIGFFAASGLLWMAFVAMLYPSRSQAWLFRKLRITGWLTPPIFLFNYLVVSIVLFGFFTFYLYGAGHDGRLNSDSYLNLFGYHFLDSIPALKIPETLRLNEPISGERPLGLGLLLILFKLTVLIPGIGAFVSYAKSTRGQDTP